MQHALRRSASAQIRVPLLPSETIVLRYGRALSAGTGSVIEVTSDEDFKKELTSANDADKPTVVDFSAAWCGPCKVIAPVYQRLSHQYPHVKFLKVDIDQASIEKTVAESNISSVPTFAFYKGGQELARVTGADVTGLRDQLDKLT